MNDIEDLKIIGRSKKVCPYYYSKAISASCEVVVLSYNYLTDPECWHNIEDYIENSILVFDEAHNIVWVLEESSSFDFEFKFLDKVIEELHLIKDQVA